MKHIKGSYSSEITFLTEIIHTEQMQKVLAFIDNANKIIDGYFGVRTSFDIIICYGSWEMEVQLISRRKQELPSRQYDDTKSIGITDYRLEEIILRYDTAKFGHYLHELLHGIISKSHPHQLKEALAWYFTLKLTEPYKYVRPTYPSWVDHLYIYPVKKLAQIVDDDDFLKDFAVGKAFLQENAFPDDVQELFLPEEVFYAMKRRYYR